MEIVNPYGFIYITTNLVNGKKYIGQKKFKTVRNDWQVYFGSGEIFKKALNKYGKENFQRDIVAIAYSKEELDKLEIEFIKAHNAVESGDYYNIADGGHSGNNFAGKSKEEMNIIFLKMKETRKYYKHSEKTKNKISQSHIGIVPSNETRKKLSEAKIGLYNGSNHPKARKVICITTNKIFDCIKDANEFYNINRSSITLCCTGRTKSAGKLPDGTKLIWMYYEDYLIINQAV